MCRANKVTVLTKTWARDAARRGLIWIASGGSWGRTIWIFA